MIFFPTECNEAASTGCMKKHASEILPNRNLHQFRDHPAMRSKPRFDPFPDHANEPDVAALRGSLSPRPAATRTSSRKLGELTKSRTVSAIARAPSSSPAFRRSVAVASANSRACGATSSPIRKLVGVALFCDERSRHVRDTAGDPKTASAEIFDVAVTRRVLFEGELGVFVHPTGHRGDFAGLDVNLLEHGLALAAAASVDLFELRCREGSVVG